MSGGYSIVDLSKYAVRDELYFCPLSEMPPDITAALLDDKPVYLKNLTVCDDDDCIKVDVCPARVTNTIGQCIVYFCNTPFYSVIVMLDEENFTIEVMKGN